MKYGPVLTLINELDLFNHSPIYRPFNYDIALTVRYKKENWYMIHIATLISHKHPITIYLSQITVIQAQYQSCHYYIGYYFLVYIFYIVNSHLYSIIYIYFFAMINIYTSNLFCHPIYTD